MAQFGPFSSYAPPASYTETRADTRVSNPPSGAQIPVFVGTGKETLEQTNLELVRGSSAAVDQQIVDEDVSDRFVLDDRNPNALVLGPADGGVSTFKVRNLPIVTGDGQGVTTNRPSDVRVTVDGVQVNPASVRGEEGLVTLQVPPPAGAEVEINYFFNRTDTERTDDVSEQVSSSSAILYSSNSASYTITDGSSDVLELTVNGTSYEITLQSGSSLAANDVAIDINGNQIEGLTASTDVDNQGNTRLQLTATGSLVIGSGTANAVLGFVSGQSALRNRTFFTYEDPIVDGTNGGIPTTDVNDVTVEVNGQTVVPESVDGQNGSVTLETAPIVGSTVEVTYFYNTFQNTFDYLPNTGVTSVTRLGDSPGRNDYAQGLDYVLQEDRILWGSATSIEPGLTTAGSEPFDDEEIDVSLVDDRVYMEQVERFLDLSLSPPSRSNNTVVLGNVPTDGSGQDNPTENPDLIQVYAGTSVGEALRGGQLEVTQVDADDRKVYLKENVPSDSNIYATYWYNRLQDDTYTLTKNQSGRVTAFSDLRQGNQYNVKFTSSNAADTIQWPSGVQSKPDAFIVAGNDPVAENVTVAFTTVADEQAILSGTEPSTFDIFENASDQFGVTLNDGDASITNDQFSVDLANPAFAVLVSDPIDTTFTASAGTFEFQLDNSNYTVSLAGGENLSTIAELINRSLPNKTEIKGTATEDFDFDNGGLGVDYNVEINGTPVISTIIGTATDSAATVASALISDIQTTSGTLTGGDITDPANDFNVIANPDGTVSIVASESLIVNDPGGTVSDDVENVLGWDGGDVPNDDSISSYALTTALNTDDLAARSWASPSTEKDYLLLRSRTTPSNPADVSEIQVLDGDANGELGFEDFQIATGAESAVNKGATLLSSEDITSADITDLDTNDVEFVIFVDGVQYTVAATDFDTDTSVGDVVSSIDSVIGAGGANVATVTAENDRVRITSNSVDSTSALEIGSGGANSYLHFSSGDTAGQRRATADEVVAVLNNDSSSWATNAYANVDLRSGTSLGDFVHAAYAEVFSQSGVGEFVSLKTFGTGSDASITIGDGGPNTDTVFNDTGIGFEIGDKEAGHDGEDGFTVSSTAGASGSAGTGLVGQTYTDDTTGLRFTVLEPSDGDYQNGESFVLTVEEQHEVGASLVNRSVPGVEMYISNIADVGVNDTAVLTTYDKSGEEPDLGDFYYISYSYQKANLDPALFTSFTAVKGSLGRLSPENPLTLAAYLAFINGAAIVGLKQVPKQEDGSDATQQDYITAIDELSKPIQVGVSPDLIVPLSTDTEVFAATVKHCEVQSSPRFRNERRAYFGLASGTRPQDARSIAQNLNSERAVIVYPDSAVLTLEDELGQETSFLVDGSFMAAALAGVTVSPANDVATPMTKRRIAGFNRLNRTLDPVEKNQLATSGVTVLDERTPFLEVRHGLTTDVSNTLTRTPSIVAIKDFVQRQTRSALDRFVGLKNLTGRAQDVEATVNGLLNSLVEQDIITAFQPASAEVDPNSPDTITVEALYSPVFPLLYIPVTYTITANDIT